MQKSKRILIYVAIGFTILATLTVAFYFIFLDLIVDYWWFTSLDFQGYFWLRLLYKYFILGGVTLLFFSIFLFHFWIAAKFLGVNKAEYDDFLAHTPPKSKNLMARFQTGALEVYLPLSILMAVIIALPFYFQWENVLLYLFAPPTGIEDPVYGNDASFYMFAYPIYQLVQKELLLIALALFLLVAFLYWIEHRMFAKGFKFYPIGVKIHLGILAAFVCLFIIWGFFLDRFSLLFYKNHEPVFFGPGYVEMHFQLPLIWLSILTFILATASLALLVYSHAHQGSKRLVIFSVAFLLVLGLRVVNFIPDLINTFIVQPNPVKAEKPFMQNNIKATLDAYGLVDVNTIEFVPTLAPLDDLLNWEGKKHLNNVPLWDRGLLKDVYFQLQGLRPYYNFLTVDEDRYLIDDVLKQVNLSAREINTKRLPLEAQNWENIHLRYTHGYGAVMTPAAQTGGQPQQWYLRDLDLLSKVGFKVKHPDIYYGMENSKYAIVPNKLKIIGIASGSKGNVTQYPQKGGIPIKSLFKKMLLAFYFNEEKIFFSSNLYTSSKLRFRRNVNERITHLAPFLNLDSDPYLVVTEDGFYWIQDAYTTSDWYPVSKRSKALFRSNGIEKSESFNYIRNSVKIVINAYNGTTDFFISDPNDPIIKAYNRAYPNVFKSLTQLPNGLKNHLRYPRDMFYQQMKIYRRYHQVKPELFYQQAETWEFPELESEQLKPYYLTTELQGCSELSNFVLLSLMTPVARDNLSGFAAAGTLKPDECGEAYSPTITMFKVRKDIQLDGPSQISALIDQDTVISEQLTLWDQHGSKVTRGRMILLPVGNTVLYLQPVYLISTKTKIPELVRVILATGSEVIMHKSSVDAFQQLEVKLGAKPEPVAIVAPKPEPIIEKPVVIETPKIKEPFIKFVLAGDVSFGYGKSILSTSVKIKLAEIADTIKQYQNIKVLIKGYTDAKGNRAYNQRLSKKRAEAVKHWLITNKNISPTIVFATGEGSDNPIANNNLPDGSDNPAGRAKNRRVEIVIEKMEVDS